MMNFAFVGPFPPQASGIADYHYALLKALQPYVAHNVAVVDQLSDQRFVEDIVEFVYQASDLEWWRAGTMVPLYQMGNHTTYHRYVYNLLRKIPGITVLHDGSLLPFFHAITLENDRVADYVREVGFALGVGGYVKAWDVIRSGESLDPHRHSFLERVARSSLGVVVHSAYMRDRVLRAYPEARVKVIPHLDLTSDSQITLSQSEAKRRLGYHAEDLIVGVMGFVAPSKRVDSLLQALKNLVSEFSNLCLVCVGQVVPGYDICSSVHHLGLADRVHMTGYVSLEEFQLYIQAIDVGVNLRYPTFGETSGALIRMMSAAKPVIVTNVGAFAEFPLHTVFRIPYGDHEIGSLTLALRQLLADQALRWQIGQAARTYIRTSCSPDVIARQYIDFIIETVRGDSPNVDPSPV